MSSALLWIVAGAVVIADAAFKSTVFTLYTPVSLGWLTIIPVRNAAGAFSLGGSVAAHSVVSIGMVAALGSLARVLQRKDERMLAAVMASAGAGNGIDWLVYGHVRDIFVVGSVFFNVADIVLIAAGATLGILHFVRE